MVTAVWVLSERVPARWGPRRALRALSGAPAVVPGRVRTSGLSGSPHGRGLFNGFRTSSHAVTVAIGLSFRFKSKFQIETEKVEVVGGMDVWGWPFFLSLFSNFNFCDCSQLGPERVNYQRAFRTDSRHRWQWEDPRKSEQTHRGSSVRSGHPAPF